MLLPCPSCSTHYDLPNRLPEDGAKVRCTNCAHVWHATNDELLDPLSDANEEPETETFVEEETGGEADNAALASDEGRVEEGIPAVSPFDEDPIDDLDFTELDESDDEPFDMEGTPLMDEAASDSVNDESAVVEDAGDQLSSASEEQGDNDQNDIDALFSEGEVEDVDETPNSQNDIDSLFDQEVSEGAEEDDGNSQGDIDSLFDDVAEPDDAGGEAVLDDMEEGAGEDSDLDENGDVTAAAVDGESETEASAIGDEEVDPFDQLDDVGADNGLAETPLPVASEITGPFWKRLDHKVMVGWACYGLMVLFVGLFLVSARASVVRALPAMAGLYETIGIPVNVLGVMFTNVQQRWETSEGRLKLKVDGEVTNLTSKYKPVPELVVVALSEEKREVFRWVVKVRKKPLLPGEKAPFMAEVPAPPERAKFLMLHFDAD